MAGYPACPVQVVRHNNKNNDDNVHGVYMCPMEVVRRLQGGE